MLRLPAPKGANTSQVAADLEAEGYTDVSAWVDGATGELIVRGATAAGTPFTEAGQATRDKVQRVVGAFRPRPVPPGPAERRKQALAAAEAKAAAGDTAGALTDLLALLRADDTAGGEPGATPST